MTTFKLQLFTFSLSLLPSLQLRNRQSKSLCHSVNVAGLLANTASDLLLDRAKKKGHITEESIITDHFSYLFRVPVRSG